MTDSADAVMIGGRMYHGNLAQEIQSSMRNIWQSVALAMAILCGCEAAARYFFSGPLDCIESSADRELLYELKPGTYDSDGWFLRMTRVTIHVGTDGCRQMPLRTEPQHQERPTALFIGDSMTFGLGVGDKDTFPALVEDTLRAQGGSTTILNCAVPGYNFSQSVRATEIRLRQTKPQLLVLVVHPADLETPVDFSSLKPRSEMIHFAISHVRLLRLVFLLTRIWAIQRERQASSEQLSAEQVNGYLDRLQAAADASGSRVLILEIGTVGHSTLSFNDILTARGFEFHLLPDLPRDDTHYLADNEHWNVTGSRIIARHVASLLGTTEAH